MAQHCNTVFVDLKAMDSGKHKELTGVPNERILQNIEKLCEELPKKGGRVIVRMPLVPGYHDSKEEVAAGARFVAGLAGRPELNLLPYHDLGETKYAMIGEEYGLPGVESRNAKDPKLLALRDLCQRLAPENRVSLGGDAILLD